MDTVVINAITIAFSDEGAGEPVVLPGGSAMTAGVGPVPRRSVWPGASFTEFKGMAHGSGGLRRGCRDWSEPGGFLGRLSG